MISDGVDQRKSGRGGLLCELQSRLVNHGGVSKRESFVRSVQMFQRGSVYGS